MINVTKTYLPELSEYVDYLEKIWESGWLTNAGPITLELEARLQDLLDVKHVFFVSNGTIALQIAIKALELRGEIITTPFSYVATTSSIGWEGCKPIFVDIHPDTLCLDPDKIEAAITDQTSAIMPVHVYGNPCDVERIETLATRHRLKVIYDAAHAFGVKYKDRSVLSFGDISTLSFHATKLFHTVEGGAIATNNDLLAHKISYLRNFGHNGPERFWGIGINGKNSEFHAAMGLCMLPKVPALIKRRREITELYNERLGSLTGLWRPQLTPETEYNYAYYPIVLESEALLLDLRSALNQAQIFPRRYFYPCLNTLEYVEPVQAPIAENISSRALCLPLYPQLSDSEVENICSVTMHCLSSGTRRVGNFSLLS